MSTLHTHDYGPRGAKVPHRPLSAALLAEALAVVAVAGLAMLAPSAWTAAKMALETREPTLAQCEMISADAARLGCFDRFGRQALQPPAKGALAPAVTR